MVVRTTSSRELWEQLTDPERQQIANRIAAILAEALDDCCGAGWLMAMGAGSEMRIARGERGLSLA
jgi:hypothetical protein